ncbi:hypothetical protein N7468_003658 [Penicillium chermesinum]|uniref:Uncharacterized protein n=1 Tax=Penicillium chermesinum TaxID=63820 RepID=A0A9W9P760_9EURO|nr:uncharacterized protein N7468_003658 [Penicillium chermesinum]KAJ5239039.1 hypothetical protein N7468_003658 [Penicillium chermesinum]
MPDSKIERVAVIGAGISGVVSAAHLLAAGIDVTVFERSNAAGGVWPCYVNLTNNISTTLLRTTLNGWPDHTPDYVTHNVLKDYIQDTAKKTGVEAHTLYGASVANVYKDGPKWHVAWKSLQEDPQADSLVEKEDTSAFDAVVVASGHYHTPLIPDIPGLAEAKEKWPSKISHSKSFRSAEGFEGKNVLLIGGAVSSTDIAKEINPVARKVFQSTRNGTFDLPATALPAGASRIAEVKAFNIQASDSLELEHLPLTAQLRTGEVLEEIDRIVICTGYQMTFPFLPQFNNNSLDVTEADDLVLITDGTQVHNLHRDIFYIPDSTLAFVGVPFYTATFSLFDFQAIAVAAHFSGVAQLPSPSAMREEYRERVRAKGYRREFHSLKGVEEEYVNQLLEWINPQRVSQGLPEIEGHSSSWREAKKAQVARLNTLFGITGAEITSKDLERPTEIEVSA